MSRTRVWAVLALLSLFGSACRTESTETPLTEVLVQIYADEQVQLAGDTLIVEVASGPKTATELTAGEPETFDLSQADFHWPATMALVAKAAHESYAFELNLRLEKDSVVLARGRVRSGFVSGQTLLLQTSLSAECLGKLDCPAGETCVVNNGRASCQDASVDSGSLPRVDNTPKSSDAGTAPVDAGKPYMGKRDASLPPSDAGSSSEAGVTDAGKPACIPSLSEVCDNGIDDNCDGKVDCADPACLAITQCVPNAIVYALVAADQACPDGYEFRDVIYQELNDPGCGGCSCEVVPKECAAYVSIYDNADTCSKDAQLFSAGTTLTNPATTTCSQPIGKQIDLPTGGYGFRVTVKESSDSCTASGEAKPVPATWSVARKRCSMQLRRSGCRFGTYCAHTRDVAQLCRAANGSACETSELASTYYPYLGYDDKRSCDACSCTPKGGSCKDVGASLTSDSTCKITSTTLHDGQKSCETISVDAAARLVGKPRDPTCQSASAESGTLTPSNPINLCCAN